MKHPSRRRRVSLPPLATFPPSPLMLEIQAASRRGDELLALALRELEQRNRIASGLAVGGSALLVGAALLWHWLHPEWPASLLPGWLSFSTI